MTTLIFLSVLVLLARRYILAHDNPYKLTFIFGKKGAGKSCYMVKMMLKYQKAGWNIYTDMADIKIPGVRIISVKDLAAFRPEPHSALFLDEVGISMDNREYKGFPPGLRDFWKYLRKMQCCCYMNSQAYDIDKKVRDTVDRMVLQVSIANLVSVSRPIIRSITLTEPSAEAESRIADVLRFSSVFSWRFYWMPNYYRYFDSKAMPSRELIPYTLPERPIPLRPALMEVIEHVKAAVRERLDLGEGN